jgi:positive regulator of sigma E activity
MQGCAVKSEGREGIVVALEGEEATVLLQRDAACGQGTACAHCALFRPESHTIRVPRDGLKQGDAVRIHVPPGSVYLTVVVLFLLPMLLAVVGFFVGARLGGGDSDLAGAAGAAVGLLVALGLATAVNRRLARAGGCVVERIDRAAS